MYILIAGRIVSVAVFRVCKVASIAVSSRFSTLMKGVAKAKAPTARTEMSRENCIFAGDVWVVERRAAF